MVILCETVFQQGAVVSFVTFDIFNFCHYKYFIADL